MTLNEITEEIKRIESIKEDSEAAHEAEDMLRAEFIAYIANNGPHDLANMAKEVLKTDEIEFDRWYA